MRLPAWFTDPETRRRLGFLAGLWLLSAVTQGYIIVPASILPRVAATLSVPETTAIWVVSIVPGAWAASNFAAGSTIDRYGDVPVTAAATGLFALVSVGTWWAGLAGEFWPLVAVRALAGVPLGVIWTASANLVGRAFPPRTRATAMGAFTASAPAGFAAGQFFSPPAARAAGWPALFVGVALLTVIALLLFLATARRVSLTPRDPSPIELADLDDVLRNRGVQYGCVLAFTAYSLYLFLNSWMPTYLAQAFSIPSSTGTLLAAVFPAMGVLSRTGGGLVSDRLFDGARVPVVRLSFVTTVPAVVIVALTGNVAVLLVVLVVAGFVIQLTFGIVYSYVREFVTERTAGTALSFLSTAGIAGAFSAPLIAGALISWTGAYAAAFTYAAGLAVLGIVLAWVAPEPDAPT